MNGVEILNQTNVYQTEGEAWIFLLCIGISFLLGLAITIPGWIKYGYDSDVPAIMCLCLVLGLFVGVISFIVSVHDTDELNYIKYQVTISDEVSLNDFMDKYEILDKDGKIYTVKENDK